MIFDYFAEVFSRYNQLNSNSGNIILLFFDCVVVFVAVKGRVVQVVFPLSFFFPISTMEDCGE